MKLADAIKAHEEFSARASENVRFLAVAGIGIVWLLSDQKVEGLARDLLFAALALVIVLCLDFLQYFVAAQIWDRFVSDQESAGRQREDTVAAPRGIHGPIYGLYWSKVAVLAIGYCLLAYAIIVRIAQ